MKKIVSILLTVLLCFSLCACNTEKQPLSAPQNLHMESKVLVWDEVEHASGYLVAFEDFEHETKFFHYDLSELVVPGTYEIDVMAIGGGGYLDSQWTKFSYTVAPLEEKEDEPAPAEYDEEGYEYHLLADGSGYEFTQGKADFVENLVIPDTFKGLPVKRIAEFAFYVKQMYYGNAIKSIQFPAHLESIGHAAFSKSVYLEELVIPDSVTEIESSAFSVCRSLKHVKLPKNLKVLGAYCFDSCSLEKIELPDGLEEIGEQAFMTDLSLDGFYPPQKYTSVVIPNSVKRIGTFAFRSPSLQEVTLSTENHLEWMGALVFANSAWEEARSNETIIIGDLLYQYNGNEPVDTYTVPATIKKIAGRAFAYKDLNEVHISNGVKLIGEEIFMGCKNLKTVRLPADMTEIPKKAFTSCKNLSELTIPEGVTTIGDSAFSSCESLSEISLPAGLQTFGTFAFSHCTSLKEVVIPASLENLGARVFEGCDALERVFYEGSKQKLGVLKAQQNIIQQTNGTFESAVFADATVYCYAETKPISGNYWHYVNGTPTIW